MRKHSFQQMYTVTSAHPINPSIKKTPSSSPSLTRKSRIPIHVSKRSDSSLKSRSNSQDSSSTSGSSTSLKRKLESSPKVSRKADTGQKQHVKAGSHELRKVHVAGQKQVPHRASNKPPPVVTVKKQPVKSTHSNSSVTGTLPKLMQHGKTEHTKAKASVSPPSHAAKSRKTALTLKDGNDTDHQGMRSQRKHPSPRTLGETQQDSGHYSSTDHEVRSDHHELTHLQPLTATVTRMTKSVDKSSHFPDVEVFEENESELFEAIAERVKKWKFLGRYLNLEDEILEDINKKNHFSGEKCMKMLLEWRRVFGNQATYLKLEEALKNILHEHLIEEIEEFIPETYTTDTGIVSGKEYTVQLTSEGLTETDSELIKDSFQSSRNDGLKTAKVALSYSSTGESVGASRLNTYSFCVDLCDDSGVCVVEDLCLCAAVFRHAQSVVFLVEYYS